MTEQAQACAVEEPVSWCRVAGPERRMYPIDSRIAEMLDSFPAVDNATAFKVESVNPSGANTDVKVSVNEACEWYEEYQQTEVLFANWCSTQASIANEEAVSKWFGPSAKLVDIRNRTVSWPLVFESHIDSIKTGKTALAKLLKNQIDFEYELQTDMIGCPFLFPKREEIADLIGPVAPLSDVAVTYDGEEMEKRPKHAKTLVEELADENEIAIKFHTASSQMQSLRGKWYDNADSVKLINELVQDASQAYIEGDYNAMEVYSRHRARIKDWFASELRQILEGHESEKFKQYMLNRFAYWTMINGEKLIMERIAELTNRDDSEAQQLDSERLNQLRRGSVYRP